MTNELKAKKKRRPAAPISILRILLSVCLPFTEPFTVLCSAIYALCGLTDILDGVVARATGTDDERGARLDTLADCFFVAAALITFLNTKLATVLTGDLSVLQNLFYALILIVIVIMGNAPALKGFREKYSPAVLWARIRKPKHDPSVIKDDTAHWANIPTKIKMDELLSMDVTGNDPYSPDKPDRPSTKEGK